MKQTSISMSAAAMVLSAVALLVAAASTSAYAAAKIASKDIKSGAVTSSKLANNSVTSKKVKNGSLTLSDFRTSDRNRILGPKVADSVRVDVEGVIVPAGDFSTFTVWCPGKRKVIGGGYFSSVAIASASAPNNDRSGWVVQVVNFDNDFEVEVDGYAICS
jgi:hypothetical protein